MKEIPFTRDDLRKTIITTPSQDGLHSGAHKVPKENWHSQGPNNTSVAFPFPFA